MKVRFVSKLVFCSRVLLTRFHRIFEGNPVAALQSEYLLHCKYVQKTLAAVICNFAMQQGSLVFCSNSKTAYVYELKIYKYWKQRVLDPKTSFPGN